MKNLVLKSLIVMLSLMFGLMVVGCDPEKDNGDDNNPFEGKAIEEKYHGEYQRYYTDSNPLYTGYSHSWITLLNDELKLFSGITISSTYSETTCLMADFENEIKMHISHKGFYTEDNKLYIIWEGKGQKVGEFTNNKLSLQSGGIMFDNLINGSQTGIVGEYHKID
jgi:hypothetical protein